MVFLHVCLDYSHLCAEGFLYVTSIRRALLIRIPMRMTIIMGTVVSATVRSWVSLIELV